MKPYKAKTITGAQSRVRELENQRRELLRCLQEADARVERLTDERQLLAKLAATGPAFFNPLEAFAAQKLRDSILATECNMASNGDPLPGSLSPPIRPA